MIQMYKCVSAKGRMNIGTVLKALITRIVTLTVPLTNYHVTIGMINETNFKSAHVTSLTILLSFRSERLSILISQSKRISRTSDEKLNRCI